MRPILEMVVPSERAGRGLGHHYRMCALAQAWGPNLIRGTHNEVVADLNEPSEQSLVPLVYDVPDDWEVPDDAIRVTEDGAIHFPDGTTLEGLEYALIREEFRLRRHRRTAHLPPRVAFHHSLVGPMEQVWRDYDYADILVTYPSMTMLEGVCMGLSIAVLPPRNDGEIQLFERIQACPDPFAAIDGLGAQRVVAKILELIGTDGLRGNTSANPD